MMFFVRLMSICLMALLLFSLPSRAGSDAVRLAVLADMSGPFADIQGPGDVVAVKMAVDDFGGKVLGRPIIILSGDHQNKADVGAALARRWIDVDKVDVILGLGNSAVALAVQELARNNRKIDIATSVATSDLTQEACSPYGLHWVFDTYALAKGAVAALAKQGQTDWSLPHRGLRLRQRDGAGCLVDDRRRRRPGRRRGAPSLECTGLLVVPVASAVVARLGARLRQRGH